MSCKLFLCFLKCNKTVHHLNVVSKSTTKLNKLKLKGKTKPKRKASFLWKTFYQFSSFQNEIFCGKTRKISEFFSPNLQQKQKKTISYLHHLSQQKFLVKTQKPLDRKEKNVRL